MLWAPHFLSGENERLNGQLEALEGKLAASAAEKTNGAAELAEEVRLLQDALEESRVEAQAQLAEAEKRVAELEQTNSELSKTVAAQQRLVEDEAVTSKFVAGSDSRDHEAGNSDTSAAAELYQAQEQARRSEELVVSERKRSAYLANELESARAEASRAAERAQQQQQRSTNEIEQLRASTSKLQAQIDGARKHDKTHGVAALEQRLQALSEHLISKQKQIELLKSEKSALRQRLSTLEKQHAEINAINAFDVEAGHSSYSTSRNRRRNSNVGARRISHLGPIAQHEGVAEIVDAVDEVTLKAGQTLQQQPWARLVFLVYFLLLHVWLTAIILFRSSPRGAATPATIDSLRQTDPGINANIGGM